jgi:histone RNA hairpin-binding protein
LADVGGTCAAGGSGSATAPFVYQPKVKASSRLELEEDAHRLEQRQKQIDLGKNTLGYQRYLSAVPRASRDKTNASHPRTPDKLAKQSKRAFFGQIRAWRRALHTWDPSAGEGQTVVEVRAPPAAAAPSEPPDAPEDEAEGDKRGAEGDSQQSAGPAPGTAVSIFDSLEEDDML